MQAALGLYGGKDVIVCAATGFRKTLTFWIPLLMALDEGQDKLTIIVTPLNLLGRQNVDNLKEVGITVVAVDAETLNEDLYKVKMLSGFPNIRMLTFVEEIEKGRYRVIIINPKLLLGNSLILRLWKSHSFKNRILNVILMRPIALVSGEASTMSTSMWGTYVS